MAHHHFQLKCNFPSENVFMRLKDNLRDLIKSHGITVVHLSRATKTPLQTLHGWLSGVEPRSLKQVKIVADYFNKSIDELCFSAPSLKKKKQEIERNQLEEFGEEINAGIFEVVLRRIKTKG